jgi:hypothetical protein
VYVWVLSLSLITGYIKTEMRQMHSLFELFTHLMLRIQ